METTTFLKNLLLKNTARKKFNNAQNYYWNCIASHGNKYVNVPSESVFDESVSDENTDLYKYMMPEETVTQFCNQCQSKLISGSSCKYCSLFSQQLGYQESQNLSFNIYGFNRTFVGPTESRFSEIQRWVTIDPEEMELKSASEQIELILQVLNINIPRVKLIAVNMYWDIMQYYHSNSLKLPKNKGDLKKGYILLCIYYSLMYNKQSISKEQLTRAFPGSRLSYLPQAESFIKQIFKDARGYSFLDTEPIYVTNLCNLINFLPKNEAVNQIKQDLKPIFGEKLNQVQIAAIIYYLYKGNVIIPETGKSAKITLKFLSERCGPFSQATLTKTINVIIDFYKV